MADSIDGKLFSAITEIRRYFKKDLEVDPYKYDVFANMDGKLYVFMEYEKFLELIKETKKGVG